jgi:dUTP pyrophosphatase
MVVKFKKLHVDAISPKFAHKTDAGADLTATSVDLSRPEQVIYGTGLAVEIPEGMVGLIFPRSSIRNKDLILSNSVGVIDSGFTGEIMATFIITNTYSNDIYSIGDRIAQLVIVPIPLIKYIEVEQLSETERNTKAYGSSGN